MSRRYFGTDGIRGKVGSFPITPEFMLKLGWAAGRALASESAGGAIVLGRDTRISGDLFSAALAAGLTASGLNVVQAGVLPTPAVAYWVRAIGARAGVVVTASHNPYTDNGVKFFSSSGGKLADALEEAIETLLDRPLELAAISALGQMKTLNAALDGYAAFCRQTLPAGLDLRGLKLVVDCAHGAMFELAPQVLSGLGAQVIGIGIQPDGVNINAGCGSTQPELLQQRVLVEQADAGIAFDGDGDRVLMVDADGELVDGDELLFILAMVRHAQGELSGVVGTLMSNFGMERALEAAGIPLERAQVGDRYVLERMHALGWALGGESSGHIICRDHVTTGDGLVAALQVLAAMVQSGQSLQKLKSGMKKYPQQMINVRLKAKVDSVMDVPAIRAAVDEATSALAGRGRVLLRTSGTEPVVRVMVEGADAGLIQATAKTLAAVVQDALGIDLSARSE